MEDDERRSWSVKCSSMGVPMCTLNKYSRRFKRLRLGMPPVHPLLHQQLSVHPSLHYIFITSCVMCYAWSVSLFTFLSFFCFFLLLVTSQTPAFFCVGEKHAPLKLEYLIGCACLFLCCELFFVFSQLLPGLVLVLQFSSRALVLLQA